MVGAVKKKSVASRVLSELLTVVVYLLTEEQAMGRLWSVEYVRVNRATSPSISSTLAAA